MKKLQQFKIFKFNSTRLNKGNYNINLTFEEALANQEIISVGQNQLFQTIRDINNISEEKHLNNMERLKQLILEKEIIKKNKKQNEENKYKIKQIQNEINELEFVPEVISVVIDSNNHYRKIKKKNFFINNRCYMRYNSSSGQSRKNTVLFIEKTISEEVKKRLNNGRNLEMKMNLSKYNAYLGLVSSASIPVTFPRIIVVPDLHIELKNKNVMWITENENAEDSIEEKIMNLDSNCWDGMGLISSKFVKDYVIKDLCIDFVPGQFIVRCSFAKGLLCTFDYLDFAEKIAKSYIVTDVWGNEQDVRNSDVILSSSQLKLWDSYNSIEDYIDNCKKNNICFGVSRISSNKTKNYTTTNYQYIQTLNLNEELIKELVEPTLQWIKGVLGDNIYYTILFLMGNIRKDEDILNALERKENLYLKCILLNNNLINDVWIKNKIFSQIEKKLKEASSGKLLIEGNYQFAIAEPFSFCENMFKMPITSLLKENQFYSNYWNNKGVKTIATCRSPLTHTSEHVQLDLIKNKELDYWYKYQKEGLIYNLFNQTCVLYADADYDGDVIFSSNSNVFLKNNYKNLPCISYEKKTAPKAKVEEDSLYDVDMNSFFSSIGRVTNISTSIYAMLPLFKEGSDEERELQSRAVRLRKIQGNSIDKSKGILVNQDIPKHWNTYSKILDTDTEQQKEQKRFNNKIFCDKKPFFMTKIYPQLKKQLDSYNKKTNEYLLSTIGISLEELKNKKDLTEDESNKLRNYNYHLPVLDSPSIMNKLCHYVDSKTEEIKKQIKQSNIIENSLVDTMIDKTIIKNEETFNKVLSLFNEYSKMKYNSKSLKNNKISNKELDNNSILELYKQKFLEVCPSVQELANYLIEIVYSLYKEKNKEVVWNMCSEGIYLNLISNGYNKYSYPVQDDNGEFEYLGTKYKIVEEII